MTSTAGDVPETHAVSSPSPPAFCSLLSFAVQVYQSLLSAQIRNRLICEHHLVITTDSAKDVNTPINAPDIGC